MQSVREKPQTRSPILQETTVLQVFPQSAHQATDTPSISLRVINSGKKRIARTLSRGFWQQKNFHAHRLRVSSPLAKTGFLSESPPPIRGRDFFVCDDLTPLMVNDRCRSGAHEAAATTPTSPHATSRCRGLDLSRSSTTLRIGLAAGQLHRLIESSWRASCGLAPACATLSGSAAIQGQAPMK
jgi:hypothetical protein